MNKKGIIFTIDALLALSIFLASAFVFYSYLSQVPHTHLSGSGIYTKSENLVRMFDKSEIFSSAVNMYQKGDTENARQVVGSILSVSEYPANVYVYLWNDSNLEPIIVFEDYSFEQKIIVRKILVMTLSRELENLSSNITVQAPSTRSGKTVNISVSAYNPTGSVLNDLDATISIYNSTYDPLSWNVVPVTQAFPSISPGETETIFFDVEVPSDAPLDEYVIQSNVTGTDFSQSARDSLNVFEFGLIKMVVGFE